MKKILLLALLLLCLPITYALTASIGNARMVLRPAVSGDEPTIIDKYILVKNVNDIPVKITLEPDARYKKIIEIFDDEITLQPGESKKANFRITLTSGGTYEGKILVTFSSADPEVKTSNVGLASNIIIFADGPVTDDYYDIMEGTPVEEEEIEDETASPTVSIGFGSSSANKNSQELPKIELPEMPPLVGLLIVANIIIFGAAAYIISKKFF